jgi:hypothetical protein
MDHLSEAVDVPNQERVVLALDYADSQQAIYFAGDSLPVCAHAVGDLIMSGCWHDSRAIALRYQAR